MLTRVTACVLGVAGAAALAGLAFAQAAWTTVTKADLASCAPVFAKIHKLELAYLQEEGGAYCTRGGAKYSPDKCIAMQKRVSASQATPDLDWYAAGNESCEDGGYPCFGPGVLNKPRSGQQADMMIDLVRDEAKLPVNIRSDMGFVAAVVQGDRCIAQAWIKKYDAAHGPAVSSQTAKTQTAKTQAPKAPAAGSKTTNAPSANAGAPRSGSNKSSRGKLAATDADIPGPPPPAPAAGLFQPDAPRPALAALGRSEAKACEDQIRTWQTESQNWQGTLDEINLRLGMMQRGLYLGRCAAHQDAGKLVAAAEQTIVVASNRAAGAQTNAQQTSPVVNDCLTPVPPGDKRNTRGVGVFLNSCDFPIYFSYCNVAPKGGSWAASFSCESEIGAGLDSVAANDAVPAVLGREISHFACRKPALPVARYTPGKGLEGFCK